MAVDVIRSRLLWSRLDSWMPALDACRLDPAQGGLGDVPAAAPSSRCRLRSRVPESASPTSSSSCRIVARPHSAAASIAAACGVDSGASPERQRGCQEVLRHRSRRPRSAHRGGCPMRKTCATCGGAGVVCEAAGGGLRPVRRRRRAAGAGCGPYRDCMALARSSQRRPAWRPAWGRWMIATGDNAAVRRARVLRTDSGRTRGGPGNSRTRRQRGRGWLNRAE